MIVEAGLRIQYFQPVRMLGPSAAWPAGRRDKPQSAWNSSTITSALKTSLRREVSSRSAMIPEIKTKAKTMAGCSNAATSGAIGEASHKTPDRISYLVADLRSHWGG